MALRAPTLKQRIREQDLLLGGFVFSVDASMPEIYASAGFDFIIIDTEHGLCDLTAAVNHIRAAKAAGIHAAVRVGPADLHNIPRLLDAGCEACFIPHLGHHDSSREALRSMRYHPMGERPTCTGVSAANYGLADFGGVVSASNRDVLSVGMVEDRECVDAIDEILARKEVDWLMPGPADLSSSLGVHGQVRHPTVLAAVDKILASARKHDIPVGMYVNTPQELPEWKAKGAKFIILSIDLKWLAISLKGAVQALRAAAKG